MSGAGSSKEPSAPNPPTVPPRRRSSLGLEPPYKVAFQKLGDPEAQWVEGQLVIYVSRLEFQAQKLTDAEKYHAQQLSVTRSISLERSLNNLKLQGAGAKKYTNLKLTNQLPPKPAEEATTQVVEPGEEEGEKEPSFVEVTGYFQSAEQSTASSESGLSEKSDDIQIYNIPENKQASYFA